MSKKDEKKLLHRALDGEMSKSETKPAPEFKRPLPKRSRGRPVSSRASAPPAGSSASG